MRYIQTSNKHIQFIEADDNGIIKSRGFEFGTVTYQISNGKITFYPVDTDKPWSQDLWSINIPFVMNGETYSTPEEAGAALGAIMDNSLLDKIEELQQTVASQQQEIEDLDDNLSEVSDDLDAEVVRASAKDAEHDAAIDDLANDISDEEARATSAETALQTAINAETTRAMDEESAIRGAINAEVSRATSAESALQASINAETSRAQSAETANADAIAAEVNRAQTAESGLQTSIASEINRAQAAEQANADAITAESNRAQAAESGLTSAINAEIARAQSAETALTNAINSEVSRAEASEQAISGAVDTEVSRAQSAESAISDNLTAESNRAQAVEQALSGAVTNLDSVKADKANAVASAVYDSSAKTINMFDISGNVLSSIDATDFIKDGMVSNVEVSNGKLVITFNTDAGKEAIEIPLTQIFDPANYYNKTDIDALMGGKTDTAVTMTISGDVLTVSGNLNTHVSNADIHVTTGDKATWSDKYTQAQVDAKVSSLSGAIYTVSGDVISEASARGVADEALGSKIDNLSGAVDTEVSARQQAINAVSGAVDAVNATVTAHTGNSDIHVTAQDKSTWNAKQDTLVAGENIAISGNVISAAGGEADDHFDSASTNPVENRVVTDAVIAPAKDYWVINGSQSLSRDYSDGIVLKYKIIQYPDDVPPEATLPDNFQVGVGIRTSPYGSPVWPTVQVTSFSGKSATVDNDNVHLEWDEDGLIISVDYPWSITNINCYTTGYRILSNSFSYSGGTIVDEAEKIIDEIGNVKQFANKAVKQVYLTNNGGSDVVLAVNMFNGDFFNSSFSSFLGDGLACKNGKIVSDLNVSLGYSGWTSVEIPMYTSRVDVPKGYNTFKLTFIDFDVTRYYYIGVGIGNEGNSTETSFTVDSGNLAYSSEYITSATLENGVLTFTTIDELWGGECYVQYIYNNNGNFSDTFSSLEYYGEVTEPIIDYVQDLNSGLTEVSGAVANKQDVLVSGTNIKTINGNSLLGSGNIEIGGGGTVDAYTKAETDALLSGKTNTATTEVLDNALTAHTTNGDIHVTTGDKATWNAKLDASALNGYATTAVTDALSGAINGKQDLLVSGTNIKTINGNSILGSGNIDIQGGGSSITVVQTTGTSTGDVMSQSAVTASLGDKADSSALTAHTANTTVHVSASEKQTWNNKSDFSGSYNDLTNKPTIPTIWTGTQAQFDQILVKDSNTIYLVS